MELVCVLMAVLLVGWLLNSILTADGSNSAEVILAEKPDLSPASESFDEPLASPRLGSGRNRPHEVIGSRSQSFALYEDARSPERRFDGDHHGFSTSHLPVKPPAIVTGLTFKKDRLYVLRGASMTIFPFVPSLSLAIVSGRTDGFKEQAVFSMIMSSEVQAETVRFPLSFVGWLSLVDLVRRGGGSIEIGGDLPERLKDLISQPLQGDEHYEPVSIREVSATAEIAIRSHCPACGASLEGRTSCDFCGVRGR